MYQAAKDFEVLCGSSRLVFRKSSDYVVLLPVQTCIDDRSKIDRDRYLHSFPCRSYEKSGFRGSLLGRLSMLVFSVFFDIEGTYPGMVYYSLQMKPLSSYFFFQNNLVQYIDV